MAGIYKRGQNYWGRFRYHGKEFRRSLGTPSRAVAQKRLTEWMGEVERVSWGDMPDFTYQEMMKHFLLKHLPLLKENSAKRYRTSMKMLHPYMKDLQLKQINSEVLTNYMTERKCSDATKIRDFACLSSAFQEFAFYKETDIPNPVAPFLKRHKKKGTLSESEPRTRYLTHKEEEALTAEIPKYMMPAFIVAIDTGLRLEELLSLTWWQINLKTKEIFIPADNSKNRKSRKVPILDRAGTILGTLPRHIRESGGQDWVFNNSAGRRYGKFTRGLTAAVKRAKLEHVVWHDLRRTCGCRLIQDYSMPLERVQKWLGHKTISTTQKSYAFLEVEHLHATVGTKTGTRHADNEIIEIPQQKKND